MEKELNLRKKRLLKKMARKLMRERQPRKR
jgi:hypothetical protein